MICPKGHASTDPEFCSECGTRMPASATATASSTSVAVPPTPSAVQTCPQCGMERKPDARFCETCRYDFRTGLPGPPPDPAAGQAAATPTGPAPAAAPAAAVAPPATPAAPAGVRFWEAVVAVDPRLDVDPDPALPCPTDAPERTFPLDSPESLVGRRSQSRAIFPAIALTDPGVSHRHLMIYRDTASSQLEVADLGSTNGTFLNGSPSPLEPGVKTPVGPDDRLEIGRWTRITFRPRP